MVCSVTRAVYMYCSVVCTFVCVSVYITICQFEFMANTSPISVIMSCDLVSSRADPVTKVSYKPCNFNLSYVCML